MSDLIPVKEAAERFGYTISAFSVPGSSVKEARVKRDGRYFVDVKRLNEIMREKFAKETFTEDVKNFVMWLREEKGMGPTMIYRSSGVLPTYISTLRFGYPGAVKIKESLSRYWEEYQKG